MTAIAKVRMNWLDGARLAAAFCIIGIHSSSDKWGEAFKNEEVVDRIYPVLFRSLAEVASTEFFILVSLFLLSLKLAKQADSFVDTMTVQARRLLVPFAAWTVFYAFFRLYKAYSQGYEQAIYTELASLSHWVGYFILGNSQFHMHFLPTLFLLLLFHRIFQLAIYYPLMGLIVVPMLYVNMGLNNWIWSELKDPVLIEYLVRFVKIITYTGYGFFAYSLYGFWQRGLDKSRSLTLFGFTVFLLGIGLIIKLIYAYQVGVSGTFIVRRDYIYYGHFLFPCAMLVAFMSSQYFAWPEQLSKWSKYSFGMYLMHPAVLDILEVSLNGHNMNPGSYVFLKYCFTAVVTLGLAVAIGRVRLLAWTTGLGPLPFTKEYSNAADRLKQPKASPPVTN